MAKKHSTEFLRTNPWWREDEYAAHDSLFSLMTYLDDRQSSYIDRAKENWVLFDRDQALRGMGRRGRDYGGARGPRLTLNVIRSTINTVQSKIIQTKPRPTFLTIGQGQRAQRKAKNTQAFSDGMLYHANAYDVLGQETVTDACTFGTGIAKAERGVDGKPSVVNIPFIEARVEFADGKRREPRCFYHYRPVLRDELLDRYGDDKAARDLILEAPDAAKEHLVYEDELTDQVLVCEAHRRPGAPGGDDGRHVITLENGTLLDEGWERRLPYALLRWGRRPMGMWGYGIPDQLRSLQYEINLLLLSIQEQMRSCGPKVFVERGSSVNQDEITNEIWSVIEYTGQEPKFAMFQAVQPELFQQLDRLYQRAFDEVGVSALAARSEKPAGLNSGKALTTFSDLETAKFTAFGQSYERLVRDVAELFLEDVLHDDDEDSKVKSITAPVRRYRQRYLEKVDKSDIVSSLDECVTQVFPTSALAQTPAAKMEQVGEWQDRGWLEKAEAMQLMDLPDLENATALATAPLEYIDMSIERMLEDGEVLRPEKWIDLKTARMRVAQALMRAQLQKVPEERWRLLATYLDACNRQLQEQAPAPAPGGPPGAAAPTPLPGGPPAPMMPAAPPQAA
jgi:hypothetical protein